MIKQIGTKVYYCNLTGNILKIVGDMQGHVTETTFEQDYLTYKELNAREESTIDSLEFPYGTYFTFSDKSTGAIVNLETLTVEFSYDKLPEVPQEPSQMEILINRVDTLEKALISVLQGNNEAAMELFAEKPQTLI